MFEGATLFDVKKHVVHRITVLSLIALLTACGGTEEDAASDERPDTMSNRDQGADPDEAKEPSGAEKPNGSEIPREIEEPPACPAGMALAALPYLDEPTCLRTCEQSAPSCPVDSACVEAELGSVCAPLPQLTSAQEVAYIGSGFAVTTDASGQLHLFYDDITNQNLMLATGSSEGAFVPPRVVATVAGVGDYGGFGNMRAAAGNDGSYAVMWYSFSQSGIVPNASFGRFKSITTFKPGSPLFESQLLTSYPSYIRTHSDLYHNFDISFTSDQKLELVMHQPRAGHTLYGSPDELSEAWSPSNDIASMNLVHDTTGAGHMFYIDRERDEAIYQYAPTDGPSTIDSALRLADANIQPASIVAHKAPGGTIIFQITNWKDNSIIFAHAEQETPGGPVTSADAYKLEDFGASSLEHDLTFSSTIGWVTCGVTERGLECIGHSEIARPLERTLISSDPLLNATKKYSTHYRNLQVESTPDGAIHVFWITRPNDLRILHHARIR